MTELSKQIGLALIEFYDTMKGLEKISDYQEREGKKATKLIMTTNDIEEITRKEVIDFIEWFADSIPKWKETPHLINYSAERLYDEEFKKSKTEKI